MDKENLNELSESGKGARVLENEQYVERSVRWLSRQPFCVQFLFKHNFLTYSLVVPSFPHLDSSDTARIEIFEPLLRLEKYVLISKIIFI